MDQKEMQSLLRMMRKEGVAEFTFTEGALGLSVKFAGAVSGVPVVAAAPAAPAAQTASAPAVAAAKPTSDLKVIRSPIVGTFYRSPSPDAPSYVGIGDRVRKGQIVCIVEAMKLMNTIESDVDGVVSEILVENAQPVQFGQELIRLSPA